MKRTIIPPEDEFDIASVNATAGGTKLTERFDLNGAAVQCTRASGTYQLQGTIDGTNWVNIGAAISASVVIPLTHYWRALRIFTTTAGTMTASLGAHEWTGHGG